MSEIDDETAEITGLQAQRARLVGLVTTLQAEITALEAADLDDSGYYEKRTAFTREIAAHQAELARINAQLKAANIARADRQAAAAAARREANAATNATLAAEAENRAAERAARAAEQGRRRPRPVAPPPPSAPPSPTPVAPGPLTATVGELTGKPKKKGSSDLGQTILYFAKRLRHMGRIPAFPEPYLVDFLAELDLFIASHKEHLKRRDAGPVEPEVATPEALRAAFQEKTGRSVEAWLDFWRADGFRKTESNIALSYEAALLERRVEAAAEES